jgi:hypothetical protein
MRHAELALQVGGERARATERRGARRVFSMETSEPDDPRLDPADIAVGGV